jgi:hypothetical protein
MKSKRSSDHSAKAGDDNLQQGGIASHDAPSYFGLSGDSALAAD